MGKECVTVGESLRQVLWGELLTVVSLVASDVGRGLMITPLVWLGGLVGLVSMGMIILGLAGATGVRSGYRKALICVAAQLSFSLLLIVMPDLGKAALTILTALAASAGVWCVCEDTEELLGEEGEQEGSHGGAVWKLYAAGSIPAAIAYAIFIYGPWFPDARLPVMIAAPLVQIAALFFYLHFLDKSQHLLRRK